MRQCPVFTYGQHFIASLSLSWAWLWMGTCHAQFTYNHYAYIHGLPFASSVQYASSTLLIPFAMCLQSAAVYH